MAFEFGSDQDLELLDSARVVLGGNSNAVWGVDQEFGARHLLDRLRALGVPPAARRLCDSLSAVVNQAEAHALSAGGQHWMSSQAQPESFARLRALWGPHPSAEVREILE